MANDCEGESINLLLFRDSMSRCGRADGQDKPIFIEHYIQFYEEWIKYGMIYSTYCYYSAVIQMLGSFSRMVFVEEGVGGGEGGCPIGLGAPLNH